MIRLCVFECKKCKKWSLLTGTNFHTTTSAKSEKKIWYNLYSCPLTTEVRPGGKGRIKFLLLYCREICAGHRVIYLRVVSFSGRIISGRFRAHRGLKPLPDFHVIYSGTHWADSARGTKIEREWESEIMRKEI